MSVECERDYSRCSLMDGCTFTVIDARAHMYFRVLLQMFDTLFFNSNAKFERAAGVC